METKRGNLSINSENLLPIIKKWMYSDKDIFIREMISNASDAITKRKKLDVIGEARLPEGYRPKIDVIVDDKEKTLRFIDNGIGMTADEVVKNITEIAFSGAAEFLEKYQDKTDGDQIIGHFGLGFYSAFMVAEQVDIDTLSFAEGAEAVHWECDGSTDYAIGSGDRTETGTAVTLHLNEDSLEFANLYKVREVLEKYCSFMPVEIYLAKADAEQEYETIDEDDLRDEDQVIEHIHEDAKYEEKENGDGTKEQVEVSPPSDKVKIVKRPVPVNDIHPLWAKQPGDCTEEEYKTFYRHVFLDYREPLFWIHLNMDYPFNLKGILYFPRINTEYDTIEGRIKLYNNQVFIAENIKEVIPEYLMLLKGVIDCPDLPLNVSRSALQNDGFVQKISNYISKKVADKLTGMCKTDRENYEKYWNDINPFIKYGCLKDEKFAERMKDYILYEDLDHKYLTLKDLTAEEKAGEAAEEKDAPAEEKDTPAEESASGEKEKKTIWYVTDLQQQSQYINLFREQNKNAVILNTSIDAAFISRMEYQNQDVRFLRIDSELTEDLKEEGSELREEQEALQEVFRKALSRDKLEVKVENFKNEKISAMVTLSEEGRRMSEMMKMYGMQDRADGDDPFAPQPTLILNAKHPLVKYVLEHKDGEDTDMFCGQLFDLALLGNRPLTPAEMTKFVERSNEILLRLAEE